MNFEGTRSPYPLDAFYPVVKDAAEEVRKNTQAPDALVGMEFLACMAVTAQALYDVKLPTGQVRPLSLNLLVVAESGERKTSVHNHVARPIYVFDAERMEKYDADIAQYEARNLIWKAMDVGLHRQITKWTQEGRSIDDLALQISEHNANRPIKPRVRRIIRQNTTERALMNALEGDGESIAFISDEGEIIIKGGVLNQTGILNKVWDGAAYLTLDRSDNVSVTVRNPRATVACMVQPKVFQELFDRRGDMMRGSGHWARYLVGYPASTQGHRYVDRLDSEWNDLPKFHEYMRELLDEFGRRIDSGKSERTILEFSDDAVLLLIDLTNQTEDLLRPGEMLSEIKDVASKGLEIAARIAALLHVFSKREGKILHDSMRRAMDIWVWHLEEFKRFFLSDPVSQVHSDMLALKSYLGRIYHSQGIWTIPKNEVLRKGPVRPKSRLDAAIEYLVSMREIHIEEDGRRRKYIYLHIKYFDPDPYPYPYPYPYPS